MIPEKISRVENLNKVSDDWNLCSTHMRDRAKLPTPFRHTRLVEGGARTHFMWAHAFFGLSCSPIVILSQTARLHHTQTDCLVPPVTLLSPVSFWLKRVKIFMTAQNETELNKPSSSEVAATSWSDSGFSRKVCPCQSVIPITNSYGRIKVV